MQNEEDQLSVASKLADTLYGTERLVVETLTIPPSIKDVILAHLMVVYHHLDCQPEEVRTEVVTDIQDGFQKYIKSHEERLAKRTRSNPT